MAPAIGVMVAIVAGPRLVALLAHATIVYLPYTVDLAWIDSTSTYNFVIMISLGMALLGASQTHAERHRGTWEFVHSLPTTNAETLLSKILAGALAACIGAVATMWSFFISGFWTEYSLAPQFPWGVAIFRAFLLAWVGIVAHTLGMITGWLGQARWFLLILFLFVAEALADIYPSLRPLQLPTLARPAWRGSTPEWTPAMTFYSGVVAFQISALTALHLGMGERLERCIRSPMGEKVGRGVAMVATAVAFTLGVAALTTGSSETSTDAELSFSEAGTESERYAVRWRADQAAAATVVEANMDAVAAFVEELSGVEGLPRLDVDIRGVDDDNHILGQFVSGAVLINPQLSADQILVTLAHETAHAVLSIESHKVINHSGPAIRFLDEGYASWVALRYFGTMSSNDVHQLAALQIAYAQVDIDELADNGNLGAGGDPALYYTLGQSYAMTLADTFGPDAVPRIARAMGRDDRPPNLPFSTALADAFHSAGMSQWEAKAQWAAALAPWYEEAEARAASLPNPTFVARAKQDRHDVLEITVSCDCDVSILKNVGFAVKAPQTHPGSSAVLHFSVGDERVFLIRRPAGVLNEADLLVLHRLPSGAQVPGRWTRVQVLP